MALFFFFSFFIFFYIFAIVFVFALVVVLVVIASVFRCKAPDSRLSSARDNLAIVERLVIRSGDTESDTTDTFSASYCGIGDGDPIGVGIGRGIGGRTGKVDDDHLYI